MMPEFVTSQLLRKIEIGLGLIGIILILLQNRGEAGLGVLGGGGEVYKLRKGFESFLFYATIVVTILIVITVAIDLRVA